MFTPAISGPRVANVDHSDSCAGLDPLVERARQALAGPSDPVGTIARLNRFFFQAEKFRVTYDLSSADHLLPGRVVEGTRGYCVGLAAVYLILAEDLGLPIHAVATPKHMFLRWDDGKYRRNIELFQQGRSVSDEDYIREQKIPQESIKRRVFLTNLSPREFLGFVYQNLGVLESQKENFDASARFYAKALRLNPKLAAAHYNRGNDSLKLKQYRKAIRAYDKALNLYPDDPWALQNRGLARKGIGKMQKAEEDWARVKAIEPGFKSPE